MGIMSFEPVPCPKCSSVEWKAVEQFTSLTPCTLIKEDGQVQVEFDSRAEMSREAATSVTTMYLCGTEECGYSFEPTKLDEMGGSND
jgi:hypothetical protein